MAESDLNDDDLDIFFPPIFFPKNQVSRSRFRGAKRVSGLQSSGLERLERLESFASKNGPLRREKCADEIAQVSDDRWFRQFRRRFRRAWQGRRVSRGGSATNATWRSPTKGINFQDFFLAFLFSYCSDSVLVQSVVLDPQKIKIITSFLLNLL